MREHYKDFKPTLSVGIGWVFFFLRLLHERAGHFVLHPLAATRRAEDLLQLHLLHRALVRRQQLVHAELQDLTQLRGGGQTEAVIGSLRLRFCRWLELTDLQPGGGSLGLVQQREASLFDDGVGEVQLRRGSRVHDFLHSVSGQKANHFHGSTQREQESKLIRINYIIVFVYSKQTLI